MRPCCQVQDHVNLADLTANLRIQLCFQVVEDNANTPAILIRERLNNVVQAVEIAAVIQAIQGDDLIIRIGQEITNQVVSNKACTTSNQNSLRHCSDINKDIMP